MNAEEKKKAAEEKAAAEKLTAEKKAAEKKEADEKQKKDAALKRIEAKEAKQKEAIEDAKIELAAAEEKAAEDKRKIQVIKTVKVKRREEFQYADAEGKMQKTFSDRVVGTKEVTLNMEKKDALNVTNPKSFDYDPRFKLA